MYRSWQRKYFPRHDFDEAIHQIADLGRSHRLKVSLPNPLTAHTPFSKIFLTLSLALKCNDGVAKQSCKC